VSFQGGFFASAELSTFLQKFNATYATKMATNWMSRNGSVYGANRKFLVFSPLSVSEPTRTNKCRPHTT
jgi:hypothetical protein